MRPTALRILLSIILIVLVASGCGRSTPNALTMEVLKNAEYQSEFTANGRAKLTNGTYKEKILPDSATEVIIKLGDQNAIGDLNGDGAGDAAVILYSNSGGSGTFRHLAAVLNQPVNQGIVAGQVDQARGAVGIAKDLIDGLGRKYIAVGISGLSQPVLDIGLALKPV